MSGHVINTYRELETQHRTLLKKAKSEGVSIELLSCDSKHFWERCRAMVANIDRLNRAFAGLPV